MTMIIIMTREREGGREHRRNGERERGDRGETNFHRVIKVSKRETER